MAYKRTSPMPIVEGGTNAQAMTFTNGTAYFDGTRVGVTDPGSPGEALTSNGAGIPPSYQGGSGGTGTSFLSNHLTEFAQGGSKLWTSPFEAQSASGSQNQNQFTCPVNATLDMLSVYVTDNSSGISTTVTLNVNSVNTSLQITIPAGTTGAFVDSTHSVSVSAGDLIQYEASDPGGSTLVGGQVSNRITITS